uniref:DNA polymerase epsilon catalytic subunit A-like n=1 Tax=Ciona intestinalis TaxID=7719 RepID=UPI00052189A3|nr:DNA polymerase epsilon catalytic subunit A-like [Ciona intestinalis]|eukprot:XP_009858713.1 DNA polymerase epsilon catalytic subunit A-like [Ciona intestinalis]
MVLQNTGKLTKNSEGLSESAAKRLEQAQLNEVLDEKYGYEKLKQPCQKLGWLINLSAADCLDENKRMVSAVDYYFLQDDGKRFKVTLPYNPYFYLAVKKGTEQETLSYLKKKFSRIHTIEVVKKEDLDLHNHLVGLKRTYLKLSFYHVDDMTSVRQAVHRSVRKNKEREKDSSVYSNMFSSELGGQSEQSYGSSSKTQEQLDNLVDIREYDVPYHVRVGINLKIHVGLWYKVQYRGNSLPPIITHRPDLLERPDPVVLAYDIETTKLPLKFPDAETDNIIMISYMIDGHGYLICNRDIVSMDVEDFEFTPKPEFEGRFTVFNEKDELSTINRFFDHVLEVKPHVFVTYNGDFFDWPFVESRARILGLDMLREIGFSKDSQGEYKSRQASHMDAYKWVKRDSYLPVGSQNLKAAAKAKLRYDPVELDPEEICRLASEEPQTLANYSVSDAVATYYLYMKYVHPFIFALCTIIPMEPDSVLRKGSGTLCEALLMVQAFHANIVFPNKQETVYNKLTNDGHLLDSETYVGGHVEALECGVFRADISSSFRGDPTAYQDLHDQVERTIKFCIETEEKIPLEEVVNMDEVCKDIKQKLLSLRDNPIRSENPVIYHLDVGAMYPNIILTNRLQPSAMVNETTCAACDFNKPGSTCQRTMNWMWRGEYLPASKNEFHRIQQQLENERVPDPNIPGKQVPYQEVSKEEQANLAKSRLQAYCRRAYKKTKVKRLEEKYTTVCQRENSFYVDTVRMFRDRRYEFKASLKRAKKQVAAAMETGDATEVKKAKGLEVLYDSLQLAHKCILNSFYGYVMRRGARWYSMEMAGIVCFTGAKIIQDARKLIDKIGRPLELDTDGIWCILPSSFPENYTIETTNAKKPEVTISYPGAILNVMVKDNFTNHQYEELTEPSTLTYERRSENSIFFEVDGPYLGMVLPAAKEEGKSLKKRYAVFNFDGSLAELKGFEVKRRGELQLIKIFQSSVFGEFLKGKTLEEVYQAIAKVADYWLDVLYSKAGNMPDSELFELITENRSMSRKLEDYGTQKSTSISTAKRLAEFLGDQMVKDAGLSCRFIISHKPEGAPVTERAIPMAIFQSEDSIKRHYLRKWTKQGNMTDFDIRAILDWNYYIERLGSAVQKIITLPAALQGITNPVPRIKHPDWLHKKLMEKNDVYKQKRITDMFQVCTKKRPLDGSSEEEDVVVDIENIGSTSTRDPLLPSVTKRRKKDSIEPVENDVGDWKSILGSPPPISDLFTGLRGQRDEWLNFHYKKWELQKKQRKGNKNITKTRTGKGLDRFIHQQTHSILNSRWQVLQAVETETPGLFKIFALIGSELHTLKVYVPRIFYVNQKSKKEPGNKDVPWRKVFRLLPRSAQVLNLYEYRMTEEQYQQHICEIRSELMSPDIVGVYEMHVPLIYRLLGDYGCMWKVSRLASRSLSTMDTDTFDHDQFELQQLASNSYLDEGTLKQIYIYHQIIGNKQIMGIFISSTHKAVVYILDSVRANRLPNLQALFKNKRTKLLSQDDVNEDVLPHPDYQFEARVDVDVKQLYRNMQRYLSTYKDERRGPTMIIYQSTSSVKKIKSKLPILHDFPIIHIHNNNADQFNDELTWQKDASNIMVDHFLESKLIFPRLLSFSKYFHIPVANFPSPLGTFVTDLLCARHLRKHNHVLWCSTGDQPDVGGMETEDKRIGMNQRRNASIEINNSGFYQTVCIQLDISSLAVNTVLQSHNINDTEGASSGVCFEGDLVSSSNSAMVCLANYDETVLCSSTFRILKSMILGWLRDVSVHKNHLADNQLQNFHQWVTDKSSLFYDPSIHKSLQMMMKKLILRLLSELKRLGSTIIFANFSSIVLCTKKQNVEDTLSYMEYISNSIVSKDIFHSMVLTVRKCWKHLLWMDNANYGGMKVVLNHTNQVNSDSITNKLAPTGDVMAEMNFVLGQYLPSRAEVQQNFEAVIAGYISLVYNEYVKEKSGREPDSTPVLPRGNTQTQLSESINVEDSNKPHIVTFSQQLINKDVMEQMFRTSTTTLRKLSSNDANILSSMFPRLPGSQLQLNNPTLELVKSICHVLSLDENVTAQVESLRRNLLRLIGVGEFAPSADWIDPCASYIIGHMTCSSCALNHDLDVCRHAVTVNGTCKWLCRGCRHPYDEKWIEQQLVEDVQRKMVEYNLQDIVCKKCKLVNQSNMNRRCECAGEFQLTNHSSSFKETLKIFRNIASFAKLDYLNKNIDWITSAI